MLTHSGGHIAGKGTYWNMMDGRRVDIAHEGILPGDEKMKYIRMPAGLMVLSGPVLGLLYAVFLPFLAIATVTVLAGGKVLGHLFKLLKSLTAFGWRPSESYLAGKKKKKAKDER